MRQRYYRVMFIWLVFAYDVVEGRGCQTRGVMANRNSEQTNATLLTISEASQLLRVHPTTLRRWETSGLVTGHRVGQRGDRRFEVQDLMRLLRSKRRLVQHEGSSRDPGVSPKDKSERA